MLFLILIGEPLRVVLSRFSSLFKGLDILQASTLSFCLGGLILYIIAIIPLHLFTPGMALWLVTGCGLASFLFYFYRFLRWAAREERPLIQAASDLLRVNRVRVLKYAAVFAMFLTILGIQTAAVQGLIFGSVHDQALYSLFVEAILENQQVPATLAPYLPEGLLYPQGYFVVPAFACHILGYSAPQAVFHVTLLFIAMSVLGAYYLGKRLQSEGNLDISFAFVAAFVAFWPRSITWGSSAFAASFCLFLVCLSLLPALLGSKTRVGIKELLIIGVLFGYLGAMHLVPYEVVIISAALWLLVKAYSYRRRILTPIGRLISVGIFSLLPVVPFLYRYIAFQSEPFANIGVPLDLAFGSAKAPSIRWFLEWASTNIAPVSYFFRREILILLIAGVAILFVDLVLRHRHSPIREESALVASTSLGACVMLCLYTLFQPFAGLPAIPLHCPIILSFMSVYLFIAMFNLNLYHISMRTIPSRIPIRWLKGKWKTMVLISLVFVVIYAPFVHHVTSQESQRLAGSYGSFAITTEDDYELMLWMRGNLEEDAVILVNRYECGSFIPSISQHKAIFPFSGSQHSLSYRLIGDRLQEGRLDDRTFEFIEFYGVTHVFIGTYSIYWWIWPTKWDSQVFIDNQRFKVVKNVGDAYLFEVVD